MRSIRTETARFVYTCELLRAFAILMQINLSMRFQTDSVDVSQNLGTVFHLPKTSESDSQTVASRGTKVQIRCKGS